MGDATPARFMAANALLILALATPIVVSQFLRNAMGVVAPDLAVEFALEASQVGALAAAFFLSFALLQIPLGAYIDVRGPKEAILIGLGLVIAGTMAFVTARGFGGLLAGRILSGAGCSAFYMCALTINSRLFEPRSFSTVAGFQLSIGNLGALCATAPLALAIGAVGWRPSFAAVAIVAVAGIVGIAIAAPRDAPHRSTGLDWAGAFQGIGALTRLPDFWPLFAMHAISVAIFVSVIGLWAGPWLSDVHGYDRAGRGGMLLIAAAMQIVGVFVLGASDRFFRSYRDLVVVCAGVIALLLFIAAFVPIPRLALPVWLGLFGFFISFTPVLTAHGRTLFDARTMGRGLTLLNFGVMAGAFAMQAGTGLIVQAFAGAATGSYPPSAYTAVFATLAGIIAATLLAYARTENRHPLRKAVV